MNITDHPAKYHLIECVGVLHHLDDPYAGWLKLVKLLKNPGIMKIGLYSKSAREKICKIRESISQLNGSGNSETLKALRARLNQDDSVESKRLLSSPDWYSVSGFRDLVMHEHEIQFNLLEIKNLLARLKLTFCGFDRSAIDRNRIPKTDWYDLDAWHDFEIRNPDAFGGMYQFWCQKTDETG
mgnify:CR=1 FL=1